MVTELIEQQEAASMEGPRALKEPGDVLWCWQTISALQSIWKSLNLDYDRYTRVWAEAEEHAIWEKIPQDKPFGTKEAMLKALEAGDDSAARHRIAVQAIAARPLLKHGGPSKKKNRPSYTKVGYGGSIDKISARLARDYPEIWERMKRGEFASAADAAREAGLKVDQPKSIRLHTDVNRVAANIKKHYTPEQVTALIEVLK